MSSVASRTSRNREEVIAADLTSLQDQFERPKVGVGEVDLAQRGSRLEVRLPRESTDSKLWHGMRARVSAAQDDAFDRRAG
jgi:hypothetical protein